MKIKICGLQYDLQEKDQLDKYERRLGEINYCDLTITLETGLLEAIRGQTLLHEILHGIFNALGLAEINEDERLTQQLSSVLYQTLIDNPGLGFFCVGTSSN